MMASMSKSDQTNGCMSTMEEAVLQASVNQPFSEKLTFLKAYFATLDHEEMVSIRNVAQRAKRSQDYKIRKKELTSTVQTPSVEEQPVEVPQPWWLQHQKKDIVSLDCEMVTCAKTKQQLVAEVGIVNFHGNEIYRQRVRREKGSYTVNSYERRITGYSETTLQEEGCLSLQEVVNQVKEKLRMKLIIGHAVEGDFRCFEGNKLVIGDFDTFDLQHHWWRYTYNDDDAVNKSGYKLKALYRHFFPEDSTFQEGLHSAVEDARATMRIFREKYVTRSSEPMARDLNLKRNPLETAGIDPLIIKKHKAKKSKN